MNKLIPTIPINIATNFWNTNLKTFPIDLNWSTLHQLSVRKTFLFVNCLMNSEFWYFILKFGSQHLLHDNWKFPRFQDQKSSLYCLVIILIYYILELNRRVIYSEILKAPHKDVFLYYVNPIFHGIFCPGLPQVLLAQPNHTST